MIANLFVKAYRVTFADGAVVSVAAYSPSEAAEQAEIDRDGKVVRVEPDGPVGPGQLYVGVSGYARMMGITPRAAQRRLAELEAAGLKRHGSNHGSRFLIDDIVRVQDKLADKKG